MAEKASSKDPLLPVAVRFLCGCKVMTGTISVVTESSLILHTTAHLLENQLLNILAVYHDRRVIIPVSVKSVMGTYESKYDVYVEVVSPEQDYLKLVESQRSISC